MIQWNVSVSEKTDRRLRAYLSQRGENENDLSQAVEQLVDKALAHHENLKSEIQKGFDDMQAGRYIELSSREEMAAHFEDVRRRGRERLAKESDESSPAA